MKPTKNLLRFNSHQAHALDAKRNLVVRANAGSGKTSVLLERIIQLLASGSVSIDGLAAVTFTRKAAAQLREKLAEATAKLAGQAESPAEHEFWRRQSELLPRASIGTIDSLCARILREHGLGNQDLIDPGFELLSDHEHAALRRQAVDRLINRLGALPVEQANARDRQHRDDMLWWAREEGYFTLTSHLVELLAHGVEPAMIVAAHQDTRPIQERVEEAQRRLPHRAKLQRDRAELRAQLLALQTAVAERNSSSKTLKTFADTLPSILEDLQEASVESDERVLVWLVEQFTVSDGKTARKLGMAPIIDFVSPIQKAWVPLLHAIDFDGAGEARALEAADRLARLLEPAHAEYLALCRETGQYDFVTVARRARDLLAADANARAELRRRFRHVLVDEFQDTNQLQWEVLSYLVGAGPQGPLDRDRLFIVGDPQQSIYRFRQADVSVFQRLQDLIMAANAAHGSAAQPTDYEEHAGHVADAEQRLGFMKLPVNYRTLSPMPLQLVDRVMQDAFARADPLPFEVSYQNLESDGTTTAGGEIRYVAPGGQAEIVEAGDDAGDNGNVPRDIPLSLLQVQCVVDELVRLHGQPRWRPGEKESSTLRFRDMAILLPSRDVVLAELEKELTRRNVPFIVTTGVGFWQRQEVRDMVSLASVLADRGDGMSLFAVLRGPIGRLTDTEILFLSQLGRGKLHRGLRLAASAGDDLGVPQASDTDGASECDEEVSSENEDGANDPWRQHPDDMIVALRDAWQSLGGRRQRLRQVYAQLGGWWRRVDRMAHSDLLQRCLEESDALAVYASEPGGEQIVANLRKLFQLVRDEENRQSPSLVRLARWLRAQVEVSFREEQAALPEERDAVRIMTIHAAKGLEFPVVAVMKMERKVRGSNNSRLLVKSPLDQLLPGDAEEFAVAAGTLALAVRHPDRPRETHPSRLLKALRRLECAQDLAESRRLFYVAATRAQERLILAGVQGRNFESWQTWFDEALGIEPRHKEQGLWQEAGQHITIITRPDNMPPLPPPPLAALTDDVSLAPIREAPKEPMLATTSLEKILQAWRDKPRDAWMAHRVQVVPHLPALPEHFPDDAPDRLQERISTSIGTLVHRLFEMREILRESPRERSDFLHAMAANLLAGGSGEVGFENEAEATPAAVERVVAGVEGILKKLQASREAGAAHVRELLEADGEAEVDFALQVERWHISGRYDKLLRCRGGFEIVDWKSDADPSAKVIADRHRPQMCLYALALYRAGQHVLVDDTIRVHLAMLHFPLVQTLRFAIEELEAHAAHLARELSELEAFSPGIEAAW
ncbi:MAG: hypothetical protein FJ271_23035 [Planctomycetes bacterium]|nr:hypothetical protein [Planctomycetota bacterium]